MSDLQIELPLAEIAAFCRRWHIIEFAVFGSILNESFAPESDVDVLVTYDPAHNWTLESYLAMYDELEALLGRPVDLINRRALERSRNPIRKQSIMNTARTIYAA